MCAIIVGLRSGGLKSGGLWWANVRWAKVCTPCLFIYYWLALYAVTKNNNCEILDEYHCISRILEIETY